MSNSSVQHQPSLSVLAVFAHPDDEGFGCGGTLAALVAGGHRVTLICATNGDVGEISDPALATPETLWQVRQGELREAMDVTGIEDVRFLNYRDSGMPGWDDNNHPNSLFQAPEAKVVEQVAAVIRENTAGHCHHPRPHGGVRSPRPRHYLPADGIGCKAVQGRSYSVALLRLLSSQFLPADVEQDGGVGPAPAVFRR